MRHETVLFWVRFSRQSGAAHLEKFRTMNDHPHIGSNLDDLLAEDGLREEVTAAAIKRVLAWQLTQAMKEQHLSKTAMAQRMHTSRSVVNRLLDERDTSVTLATLARASLALGRPLRVELAS